MPLADLAARVRRLIDQNDFAEAMHGYRLLRRRLLAERLPAEERRALRSAALTLFHDLKEAVVPVSHSAALRRFTEHRVAAERFLDAGELEEAIVQYRSLRLLYDVLPVDERPAAQPLIETLYHRLSSALAAAPKRHHPRPHPRRVLEHEERRLRGRP